MSADDVQSEAESDQGLPDDSVHPTIPLTPAEKDLVRYLVRQEIRRWMQERE